MIFLGRLRLLVSLSDIGYIVNGAGFEPKISALRVRPFVQLDHDISMINGKFIPHAVVVQGTAGPKSSANPFLKICCSKIIHDSLPS